MTLAAIENTCKHCGMNLDDSVDDNKDGAKANAEAVDPSKMNGKQAKMAMINNYRKVLDDEKERFPDIKVSEQFRAEFEMERGMKAGSSIFSGITLNDEIRILYLQRCLENMESTQERKMREHEIRLKGRIYNYGRACVEMIEKDLQKRYKFMLTQLDYMNHENQKQTQRLLDYEKVITEQSVQIIELKEYAHWEENSHKAFMRELDRAGLKEKDLISINIENQFGKQQLGLQRYYSNFYKLHEAEKDNLLLAQPFKLYSNSVRLGVFEKLNTLERETVKFYRKKALEAEEKAGIIEATQKDVNVMSDLIEQEKKVLVEEKLEVVREMKDLKQQWKIES